MRKELENIILKQVRKIASEQGFPIHKNFMCLEKSKSVRGLYNIKGDLGSFFIKNADSDKPTMVYFEDAYSRKGRREIPLYTTNDSKTSYENYQLKWMMDHGYSLRDLMQSMDEYYDDKYIVGRTFDDLFTEWKNESGFNQELWSCKEEAINAGECNDTLKEEPSDIEKMIEELTEDVMDLSLRQPDGAVHNADTILEDSVRKVDFQTEGISNDILKLYLEAENKEDFKSLFYVMTDMKFEDYLLKSQEIMKQNIIENKSKNVAESKDVSEKEPTDFEGTVKELTEQVLDLSTKQPDGMIHDADTILADIMEAADFQVSGISDDILKLYLDVENKDDFESLFYLMTDEKFENYLLKSKKIMEQNIAESKHLKYKLTEKDEIGDIFHHMKIFTSLYYNASGVPYIKLTDSMDASDLKKIANVLGIYSIKANEFCISKKKALICNLDFVDIMRIAEHEKYNVETGIIKNSNDECYILTRK